MAGYTPGPWMFDGETPANQGFDIAQPDGGVVATAYYDAERTPFSVSAAEANARLIAAAPELYEALRGIMAFVVPSKVCCNHPLEAKALLALAKVEGRTS